MRHKIIALLPAVLLLTICTVVAQVPAKPAAQVDHSHWDFGIIPNKKPVQHTYIITNTGQAPLHIVGVSTTCGCIAALPRPAKIAPGKQTRLTVTFDPKGRSGIFTGEIRVTTNIPGRPMLLLSLKANIYREIEGLIFSGKYLSFGEFQRGVKLPPRSIWLTSLQHPNFKITAVQTTSPYFKVSLKRKDFTGITPGVKNAYTISVWPSQDIPYGRHEAYLQVKTDIPGTKPLKIGIFARVAGHIGTTRDYLAFGLLKKGVCKHKHFFVFHRQGGEVQIKGVSATLPFIKASYKVIKPKQYYRVDVTIEWAPTIPAGEFRGFVQVKTDNAQQPVLKIWVQGIVKQ